MSTISNYGVVFSGGGALGAWEVGCLRAITRHHNGLPAVMSGASAGALNAAALASGMTLDELADVWKDLRPKAVFRPRPKHRSWFGLAVVAVIAAIRKCSLSGGIREALGSVDSLLDSTPLEATLRGYLQPRWQVFQSFPVQLVIATTDLKTKNSHYFYKSEKVLEQLSAWEPLANLEVLVKALLASAAVPVAFPPVGLLVDGGVSRNQPLGAAVRLLETGEPIYVLMPNIEDLPGTMTLENLPERVLETWLGAGLDSELQAVGIKNTARFALDKPLIPICVIRSTVDLHSLGSGLLKFGSAVTELIEQGTCDADNAMKSFAADDPSTWPKGTRPLQ